MKNHQKGFANIVLIGAIVVLVAFGGYFVWSKKSEDLGKKEVSNTENSTDWKTYKNERYGIEFNYPNDWKIIEETSGSVFIKPPLDNQPDISFDLPVTGLFLDFLECPFSTHEIECKVIKNKNNVSYIRAINTGQLDLDNQQQLNAVLQSPRKANMQFITILTDKKGEMLNLSQNSIEVFDKILSTFKFTEVVTPTKSYDNSTWKTYSSVEYGFEFKYPEDYEYKITNNEQIFKVNISKVTSLNPQLILANHFDVGIMKDTKFNSIIQNQIMRDKNFLVGGVDALRSVVTEYSEDIKLIHKDKLYTISLLSGLSGESELINKNKEKVLQSFELYNQILSTFKFTK